MPAPTAMNAKDEGFFKALGARIAQAQGARTNAAATGRSIGYPAANASARRTRARSRTCIDVANAGSLLTLSLDELVGNAATRRAGKRAPRSRLQQQIEAIDQLPKTKRQIVSQMLDTVLAQTQH